jgi:ribosomal protein S16
VCFCSYYISANLFLFYFTLPLDNPTLSHYIYIMRMYHKQQKSDLRLIESLGLFSPVAEARDSLRKLDASKDKGRVLGGVSHFVLRVRYLSSLISYLGNATLRTLGNVIIDLRSPYKLGQRFAL